MFAGCAEQRSIPEIIDLDNIDLEQCHQARGKFIEAFIRFHKDNEIDGILYIFEDSKPVVSIESIESDEAYRFLWLRSFHSPVLITVIVENDKALLNLRVSENSGCMFPVLIKNKIIQLTRRQLLHLRKIVEKNPFWEGEISDASGHDGSDWVVEVKQQDAYYFGKEWTPSQGAIRNIGICLLQLSEYDPDTDELY